MSTGAPYLAAEDAILKRERLRPLAEIQKMLKTSGFERSLGSIRNRRCVIGATANAAELTAIRMTAAEAANGKRREDPWLVLLLSDVHHGSLVKGQDGKVLYNAERCECAVRNLPSAIQERIPIGQYAGMVILALGDLVDGEGIYPTQAANLDVAPLGQLAGVQRALVNLIQQCAKIWGNVLLYGIPGNHGRTGKDRDPSSNWDCVLYQQLANVADMLPEARGVEVRAAFRDGALFELPGGARVYCRHEAIVQDGTAAPRAKMGSWYEQHRWDVMCCGHYHRASVGTYNGRPVIRNGAIQPQTDYGEKLAVNDPPTQVVFALRGKDVLWTSFIPVH